MNDLISESIFTDIKNKQQLNKVQIIYKSHTQKVVWGQHHHCFPLFVPSGRAPGSPDLSTRIRCFSPK